MPTSLPNDNRSWYFLQGGGEMGRLTRDFDWSQTTLGDPGHWPQSLRTSVAMTLSCRFPMLLMWGKDLIQLYNDDFRPSLGIEGKHPLALGQKAKDCWPEIWEVIEPLLQRVLQSGEATWMEDQLIPIYRNGKIENVYWTFSYSPLMSEAEKVEGVLVVCTETTRIIENLKETATALKETAEREELFRTMAEGTNILIAVGDETSNANYFNKAWVYLTGRPMEDLLKFGWVDLVHPEDRDRYVNIYLSAFDKRAPFTGEFRVLNKEGTYSWLLAKGTPRLRADGSFAGYISSCIDITERKTAENALLGSEQQVRALVDSAPFPIGVYTGKEKRIILANQAMLDAWGKGDDVIGKLYTEILPELQNQAIFEQIGQVFATGQPFHARNQRVDLVVENKLQLFYFNYSFTPLYDVAGKVYGVMNTAADVSDLNRALLKVEENEKTFRNTILKAPVAMCIFRGPQFLVEVANDRMIGLWGKTPAEVLSRPIFEGLPEAKGQGFEQLLENVFLTGDAYAAQDVPVTLPRDGKIETVYVNFLYEALREPNGSISGIIAVALDVTSQFIARRQIEEVVAERTKELGEANKRLQRSNAELAQFAYIASHDLQEPVRKVSMFSQMLEDSLDHINDLSRSYLNRIHTSTERMLALIRDVLAYSELSKETQVFARVDLKEVVEGITTDFELLIEQKMAAIHYAGLPVIEAIPLQMGQLFGNLISNALKFARKDPAPIITITARPLSAEEAARFSLRDTHQLYYSIEVKDNGIGFSQAHAEQIFSIFQRLHGKKEYPGTGIGLAMCKKITQHHHGDIFATGHAGSGASFTVILPARQTAGIAPPIVSVR